MPIALAVLLALISWQVTVHGPLLTMDMTVRHGVRDLHWELRSTLLNHLGTGLADLGGGIPAVPVLLAVAAVTAWLEHRGGRARWWLPLPVAALSALLIPLLVVPAKAWFARPGPDGLPLTPGQWGWYPSGHTATSAIAYGTAALLLGRALAGPARRRLYAGAAALCGGVGLGLVWSDYHWLLDVLASWCLAGTVLWCLTRWVIRR